MKINDGVTGPNLHVLIGILNMLQCINYIPITPDPQTALFWGHQKKKNCSKDHWPNEHCLRQMRGLCLMKLSSETLQNMLDFEAFC